MIKIKFELHINVYKSEEKRGFIEKRRILFRKKNRSSEKEGRQEAGERTLGIRKFLQQEVAGMRKLRSESTINNYETAVRSLLLYVGKPDLDFHDITAELIGAWQKWLRLKGVCLNTSSCYVRSLRSLCHVAAKKGFYVKENSFEKAFTGRTQTEKRAIETDDIKRMMAIKLKEGTFLALARDLFLFSCYALGMPFVDLAFLKKSQLSDNKLTYDRRKTGQRVSMQIEPCMREIINKYDNPDSPYIFPLLTSQVSVQSSREYLRLLGRYNRALKVLARKAGIHCRLTSYCSRHTWASLAYQKNIDLPVISKALGHTDTHTTLLYIRGINDKRLHDANKKLLDDLTPVPLMQEP